MNNLADIATFKSALFTPLLPEDAQVNPEVYGAELAYWLCRALATMAIPISYPASEDWGWYLDLPPGDAEFAIHCSNCEGMNDHWMLSLCRYSKGLFGSKKPSWENALPLVSALRQILQNEPAISDLEWLYKEEVA